MHGLPGPNVPPVSLDPLDEPFDELPLRLEETEAVLVLDQEQRLNTLARSFGAEAGLLHPNGDLMRWDSNEIAGLVDRGPCSVSGE